MNRFNVLFNSANTKEGQHLSDQEWEKCVTRAKQKRALARNANQFEHGFGATGASQDRSRAA